VIEERIIEPDYLSYPFSHVHPSNFSAGLGMPLIEPIQHFCVQESGFQPSASDDLETIT
jgi:hypothetical protein